MVIRRTFSAGLLLALAAVTVSHAQDDSRRGRKYKAPPETSHFEVLVLKDSTHKPVANAAVVFHAVKDGKDEGNLEVKTNEEGKATIDVIATGSNVDVQVIADGLATYANTYLLSQPSQAVEIRMLKPRAQVSTYVDTRGQQSTRPPGVQEPTKPATAPSTTPPAPGATTVKPPQL